MDKEVCMSAASPLPTANCLCPGRWYMVDGKPRPTIDTVQGAVRVLLMHIGVDPATEPGIRDTPARVVRAFSEMTAGYRDQPEEILERIFPEDYDEVILVRNVPFVSLCEHHLLVFSGTADVGYLPAVAKGVVGLSKLARLVDCYARRLQVQERLTRQIADAIDHHLTPRGVGVIVRARHSCMECRGARKSGAEMVTSCLRGVFRDKPEARAEFLQLCRS